MNRTGLKFAAAAAIAASLAACGGGSADLSRVVSVSGTAASGKALGGATVSMTCANGLGLSGKTGADGTFTIAPGTVVYPCAGTATMGATSYRGILFSGAVANFTPLTDLLVTSVLASSGLASIDAFVAKTRTDAAFATNVSQPATVATYRAAVVTVVRNQLIAAGNTPAQADATLSALNGTSFESVVFAANGTGLDKVLDMTGPVLQNSDGTVKTAVTNAAITEGKKIPAPGTGTTGASGT
ncbi:hypothetical protein [Variovorax terrae]|uniref:Carboxypeptidase regulatory-like domain-containing protein n=1 Tax=Variovorax terrae TaxID=2923278 RepID=A0A9X1VVV9_9BURK|nr:hypothetical protein [Variovorax terrae]MCJ0764337.1 hypothetical protein [Variovorax terrae]